MIQETVAQNAGVVTDIDPFSRDYIRDPYPYHEQMRAMGSVLWLDKYGCWCLPHYSDVKAALADNKTFCSGAGVGLANFNKEEPWRPPSLLLEADQPAHTPRRAVVGRMLGPANIRELRPQFQENAKAMVDKILDASMVCGFKDVAKEYVLKVFPDAVGVQPEGRDNLLLYGTMVFNAFGVLNDIFEDSVKDAAPVIDFIMENCRRENLTPDGIGAQIYAAADAGEIPEEEAFMLVRSLLSAGVDTTIDLVGNVLYCFAQHPAEWEKLKVDPSKARAAIEEVLRFESPFQGAFRTTTRDVEVDGTDLGADQKVFVVLGSANRDPAKWANPTRFDIDRKPVGQIAFGTGIHGCVGQMISRLEVEVLLSELVKRVDRIEFDGLCERKVHNTLRGFEHLPLRFVAGQN